MDCSLCKCFKAAPCSGCFLDEHYDVDDPQLDSLLCSVGSFKKLKEAIDGLCDDDARIKFVGFHLLCAELGQGVTDLSKRLLSVPVMPGHTVEDMYFLKDCEFFKKKYHGYLSDFSCDFLTDLASELKSLLEDVSGFYESVKKKYDTLNAQHDRLLEAARQAAHNFSKVESYNSKVDQPIDTRVHTTRRRAQGEVRDLIEYWFRVQQTEGDVLALQSAVSFFYVAVLDARAKFVG